MTTTPYQYDRERVRTDDLAVVLDQWCQESEDHNPINRMAMLAEVDLRTLYAIRNKRTKSTSFFLADKILTKIGLDMALRDGRIRKPGQRHGEYHKSAVDCSTVRPHTKELVERCGGAPQAAQYALVTPQTINRVLNEKQCTIQQATARKILIALEHRREEDIEVKKIHDRLLRKRQQDVIESDRERLVGY
jgi:hypothetical protein